MLLRITVNDNDFTEILENFAQDIDMYSYVRGQVKNMPTDDALAFFKQLDRFRELFYSTDKYTTELADELCNIVRHNWELWVNYCLSNRDHWTEEDAIRIKEWLVRDFKVKFQKSLTPKWENGEVVYICCGYYNRWWTF